jgi:hypothetical protein
MRHSLSAILACAVVGSWWWWSETPRNTNRAIANDASATQSDATGKRLKIQLELATADDLKVKEGQRIVKGQLIANHRRQQITAPDAGSILRVRLLSRQGGLLKYEVVLLCSQTPPRTPLAQRPHPPDNEFVK